MKLLKTVGVTCLAAASVAAFGQAPLPSVGIRVHLGYTQSDSILLRNGSTAHLSGTEVGVEFPFMKLPGNISLNLYPSAMLGGKFGGIGSTTTDGRIFRFLVSAHLAVPVTQFYGFAAAGISNTSNSGSFDDVNAFEAMVGGGLPLTNIFGHFSPNLEVAVHNSSKPALRGITFGLSASF